MSEIQKLLDLAARVEAAKHCTNTIDVEVEIALFKPDANNAAIRANDAGTKVIYTGHDGSEQTHWSQDWTLGVARRAITARALRARAATVSQ